MRTLSLLAVLGTGCGRSGFEPLSGDGRPPAVGRMKLTFDETARGLSDLPVRVVLDPQRWDYSVNASDGGDVHFVDAQGATLAHELESWDPSGVSSFWVGVPEIDGGNDFMWLQYGDGVAMAPAPAAVWTAAGYLTVLHLNENPAAVAPQFIDSAGEQHGTAIALDASDLADGRILGAIDLDGSVGGVQLDGSSIDPPPDGTTISAWVWWRGDNGASQSIVAKRNLFTMTGMRWQLGRNPSPAELRFRPEACCDGHFAIDLPQSTWTHVVITQSATSLELYLDGVLVRSQTPIVYSQDASAPIRIGCHRGDGTEAFNGLLDEVRISARARSGQWIAAERLSDVDGLLAYGPPEPL